MGVLVLSIVVLVLVTAFFGSLRYSKRGEVDDGKTADVNEECCGAHEICEVDLLNKMSEEIVYYDDEELDACKNYKDNDYTNEQIDEFREVLYSLKDGEINGWLRSLELREIVIPSVLKSELVLMLAKG